MMVISINFLTLLLALKLHSFNSTFVTYLYTVEPRFNEVAGDRPNLFIKWRVRYIEVLFHTFYCNFGRHIEIISFVISRTSLNRGSLNRGSIVAISSIQENKPSIWHSIFGPNGFDFCRPLSHASGEIEHTSYNPFLQLVYFLMLKSRNNCTCPFPI